MILMSLDWNKILTVLLFVCFICCYFEISEEESETNYDNESQSYISLVHAPSIPTLKELVKQIHFPVVLIFKLSSSKVTRTDQILFYSSSAPPPYEYNQIFILNSSFLI